MQMDTASFTESINHLGERASELVEAMQHSIDLQTGDAMAAKDTSTQERIMLSEPQKWLDMAKTHLQMALMFAERANKQPTSF